MEGEFAGKVREKFGVFPGQIRGDFGGRFDTDLHCKPAFSGTRICSRKFIFNKLWDVIPGRFAQRFGSDLAVILVAICSANGPQFAHVNYHSGNYVWRFGGDLAVNFLPIHDDSPP